MSIQQAYELFPLNSNDGHRYMWNFYNDSYCRAIVPHAKHDITLDWADCQEEEGTRSNSARNLMKAWNLVLNSKDQRTDEELDQYGRYTVYRDVKGKIIGFYHWESGIVASLPEWKDVDWQEVDTQYQRIYDAA